MREAPLGAVDARTLARSSAALHATGSVLALGWLALEHRARPVALAAIAGAGLLGALVVFLARRRLPRAAFPLYVALGMAFVSAGIAVTGGWSSPFSLFYISGIAWSFAYLPARIALAETGFIALAYAVAGFAAAEPLGGGEEVGTWFLRIGTIVTLAVLLAAMADRVARRTREVRSREARQGDVAALGIQALGGEELESLLGAAAGVVARGLGTEVAWVAEHRTLDDAWIARATEGIAGEAILADGLGQLAAEVLETAAPAQTADPARLAGAGVRSAVLVPLRGRTRPLGVLGAAAERYRPWTQDDVNFLWAVANLLAGAIDRVATEESIRHRALHDPLTGLPNRVLVLDRLALALERTARTGLGAAVLFLDLDGFKRVNDALGHRAGDDLLVALAPRLRRAVRGADTVARLGGDEFAVVCADVSGIEEAEEVARRLGEALRAPIAFGEHEAHLTASVGIALGEVGSGADAETLLRDADAALYRAKERGRARYEVFDELLRERTLRRHRTEEELARAVERGELRLAYEPVVDLASGVVVGAEALVRWAHPERGMLRPDAFIDVAEASGLIVGVGQWVLERACRDAAAWGDGSEAGPWVSVNLSARQLVAAGLVHGVAHALDAGGLSPERLRLELTESTLVEDAEGPRAALAGLRELGAGLVLDDFGTGWSSLGYLRRLPIDTLKIDRSFVAALAGPDGEAPIVEAIVALAAALDLEVIGEGVEHVEQGEALLALGCRFAQGYALGRGRSARALGALVSSPRPTVG